MSAEEGIAKACPEDMCEARFIVGELCMEGLYACAPIARSLGPVFGRLITKGEQRSQVAKRALGSRWVK